MRLLSASDCRRSRSASQTRSAASIVQPPRKTESAASSFSLLGLEQLVRPLDRGAERLLAHLRVAAATQEVETVAEAFEQLLGRQERRAGGGELERERQVVEACAEVVEQLVRLEVRLRRPRPRHEEPPRLRPLEHRHRVDVLALHAQPLPARHEHIGMRASREDGRHLRRSLHDMLKVVQQKQQPTPVDELRQRAAAAERTGGRRSDIGGIGERSERHPPHAVRIRFRRLAGRVEREPRLPRPARARQREETGVVAREQLPHVGELVLAAEKRRRRDRQVRPVERLQRRKLVFTELVDPLGSAEILEPVLAEIAELGGVDERRRHRRDEHLPAVTGRRDPCGAVDVGADITLLRQQRRAGVEAHPHGQLELLLRLARCVERAGRGREGNEERVALRVDLDAAVALERLAHDAPVLGERVRVRRPHRARAAAASSPRYP